MVVGLILCILSAHNLQMKTEMFLVLFYIFLHCFINICISSNIFFMLAISSLHNHTYHQHKQWHSQTLWQTHKHKPTQARTYFCLKSRNLLSTATAPLDCVVYKAELREISKVYQELVKAARITLDIPAINYKFVVLHVIK